MSNDENKKTKMEPLTLSFPYFMFVDCILKCPDTEFKSIAQAVQEEYKRRFSPGLDHFDEKNLDQTTTKRREKLFPNQEQTMVECLKTGKQWFFYELDEPFIKKIRTKKKNLPPLETYVGLCTNHDRGLSGLMDEDENPIEDYDWFEIYLTKENRLKIVTWDGFVSVWSNFGQSIYVPKKEGMERIDQAYLHLNIFHQLWNQSSIWHDKVEPFKFDGGNYSFYPNRIEKPLLPFYQKTLEQMFPEGIEASNRIKNSKFIGSLVFYTDFKEMCALKEQHQKHFHAAAVYDIYIMDMGRSLVYFHSAAEFRSPRQFFIEELKGNNNIYYLLVQTLKTLSEQYPDLNKLEDRIDVPSK